MKLVFLILTFIIFLSFNIFAQTAQTPKTAPDVQVKQLAPKPDLTEQRLRAHIEYLASDKLEGRRIGEPGATVAAGYVAGFFPKFHLKGGIVRKIEGKKVTESDNFLQTFSYNFTDEKGNVTRTVESYNVIGILEGTDAVLKNEAIVIGAHYDHLGKGGQGSLAVNSTEIHHGADDNASGVAGVLELARDFAKERKNKRTLIFIAFGGEEEGLIGSKFYVNDPVFPLEKTVAMINMDMIGRLRENKLTIGGIGTASEWKSLVETKNSIGSGGFEVNGKEQPITKVETKSPQTGKIITETNYPNFTLQISEDGFGPSDHSSFYGKQIPVLFFFTGAHEDYHKPSDTADKINFGGMKQVLSLVEAIIKTVDANEKRPTYTVAKSSGTGEGRRSFGVSLGTMPNYSENANDGLLLDAVRDGSPAAKAGIKAGDKITKLAGKIVKNIQDYTAVLGEMKAGEEYEIEIVRNGETLNLKIIPAARKQ